MIMGLVLFILFWGLMAASIALPIYGIWKGYRRSSRAWAIACCLYIFGIALLWLMFAFLDNSEGLRGFRF